MSAATPGGPGGRRVGLLSLGVGLAAAGIGAAVGVAAERAAMGRPLLPGREEHSTDDGDGVAFGSLRGVPHTVLADDGTKLHAEVDEVDPERAVRHRGAPLTVVLSHGYALNLDSWHYQRKALRGRFRLVLWDQRGHGRSANGPEDSATIDQCGRDLSRVVDALAADGPVVLVGHSMGGMTVMSLAQDRPDLVAERVVGVALVATSAGGLAQVDFGVPRLGRLVQKLAPAAVQVAGRGAGLVERGRRLGSDLESVLVRRYSYASPVSQALVDFTAQMIASTTVATISEFFPTFGAHDKREALAALDGREVLVLVGDADLLTPPEHSEEIVRLVPGAEHVVVRDAGHLVMLEHPDVVTGHLAELVERALRASDGRRGDRRRVRRTVTPVAERRGRGRRGRTRRGGAA